MLMVLAYMAKLMLYQPFIDQKILFADIVQVDCFASTMATEWQRIFFAANSANQLFSLMVIFLIFNFIPGFYYFFRMLFTLRLQKYFADEPLSIN